MFPPRGAARYQKCMVARTSDEKLYLLSEVATKTRTTVGTVRHWIRTGRLKSYKPGRRRLVSAQQLNQFLRSKSQEDR